jgi:uncharacterized protein YdeI (YjbR/CyaY-like superfamily)
MEVLYFPSAADFRSWLTQHHADAKELWVGYYKKGSGQPSLTYPESVDQALCFGWIDGVRKNVDKQRYTIRFTPRRPGSAWSAVNLQRLQELIALGLVQPAGMQAFKQRQASRSGVYSYENRSAELAEPYAARFKQNPVAWEFYQAQPPYYRKTVNWWVLSAKKEATRLNRLETLIAECEAGRRIDFMKPVKPKP